MSTPLAGSELFRANQPLLAGAQVDLTAPAVDMLLADPWLIEQIADRQILARYENRALERREVRLFNAWCERRRLRYPSSTFDEFLLVQLRRCGWWDERRGENERQRAVIRRTNDHVWHWWRDLPSAWRQMLVMDSRGRGMRANTFQDSPLPR